MAKTILRDYQKEALETVAQGFESGTHRQLIVLPTGAGKTVIMAAIAKRFNKKTLLIAHREELIQQAYNKFKLHWSRANIGICKATQNDVTNQIVIGSIQSCIQPKRLQQLKEQGFEILMIDEAHHASSDSYQKIITELGFDNNKTKLLLGVTATPKRSDKKDLGNTFDKITFSRSIGALITNGYLSPVVGRKILTNFSLQEVKSFAGDFAVNQLSHAVNIPERNTFVVNNFKNYTPKGAKALAFCVDVQHTKDLADEFNKQGIRAAAIYGTMNNKQRKKILKKLKRGNLDVVTSCSLLTEGFDEPSITVIIMARPTKSQSLYIQMVGRGLRLFPGKERCLVLDFTDQYNNLNTVISLHKAIPEANYIEQDGILSWLKSFTPKAPTIKSSDDIDEEFDIIGNGGLLWIPIGDGEESLLDDNRNEIVISPCGDGFTAQVYYNYDPREMMIVPLPISSERCKAICEDYAQKHFTLNYSQVIPSWFNQAPTTSQIKLLNKKGHYGPIKHKADASVKIKTLNAIGNKRRRAIRTEPVTTQQQFFLNQYNIDTHTMTKKEAMSMITRIKKEGNMHGYQNATRCNTINNS